MQTCTQWWAATKTQFQVAHSIEIAWIVWRPGKEMILRLGFVDFMERIGFYLIRMWQKRKPTFHTFSVPRNRNNQEAKMPQRTDWLALEFSFISLLYTPKLFSLRRELRTYSRFFSTVNLIRQSVKEQKQWKWQNTIRAKIVVSFLLWLSFKFIFPRMHNSILWSQTMWRNYVGATTREMLSRQKAIKPKTERR